MNAGDGNKTCEAVGALLVFYVCDEVNEQERAAIEVTWRNVRLAGRSLPKNMIFRR